ncbi:hypothetical protein [Paraburkholderia kururiensis]|uniref:hypothetical protein n=1 Tax=Paraburkholderia kururiensis TaxID=984307 RepID=UPI0039A62498
MAGIDERAASVVILEAHFDRSCLGDFMGVKQYEPKTGIHSKRMVTSHNRVETLIGHERWRTKARAALLYGAPFLVPEGGRSLASHGGSSHAQKAMRSFETQ